jgi:cathepsin B
MKLAILLAAPALGAEIMRPTPETKINDPDHIAFLNSEEGMTWVAGPNERFEGLTYSAAEVQGLFGAALSHIEEHADEVRTEGYPITDVPAEFNAVTHWQGLVHPIRDQQQCGSCWAFSASEVLSDRFSIQANKSTPVLSPEDLVSCDKTDMGCSGGQLPDAWKYLEGTGIVTDTCFPYTAGGGTAPACATTCADKSAWKKYKASSAYAISGVENMQKDIMTHGPIQVAFKVYKSFMNYKSGVYKKKWYELLPEGGHAVKIVGWGTESGTDYWLVANSWNTSWGEDGSFKIARGIDECGMESMGPPYAGLPSE